MATTQRKKKFDATSEARKALALEGQAILRCARRLNSSPRRAQMEHALQLLAKCLDSGGKIIVTGVGKSGKIAQKIAATLSSTGSLALYLHPTEGLHGDLGVVQPKDVVLALSYSGNTDELLRLLPSLKELGASLIGIGGNTRSELARHCAAWVDASVTEEACPHRLAPTASTTLALALGDAIAVTLMRMRGFGRKEFARFHPAGALGRRLSLRVSEVMHTGDAVPTVSRSTSVERIIVLATEKKLGGVLVTDTGSGKTRARLAGLITDGDIRRALRHRERFFKLTASDIMTRNPVTIRPEAMAADALQLMQDRPSQISVLPVVADSGEWKGLLRLHDLVRVL